MELDAVDGEVPVHDAHDCVVGGCGRKDKAVGYCRRICSEGVVTCDFEGIRESVEQGAEGIFPGFIGQDAYRSFFAVDKFGGVDDDAAEGFDDRLVAQADTEYRDFACKVTDCRDGDAGGHGESGTRGYDDM